MSTVLSSRWTPFYKFVAPALAAVGLGFGVWSALRRPGEAPVPGGFPPALAWLSAAAMALLIGGLIWWSVARLKRVVLVGDELVISNYVVEIRVPLTAIESISKRSTTNPKRYTVAFAEPTEFGRTITFMPPMVWSMNPWAESEAVGELRAAWTAAQDAAARRQR